MRNGEYMGNEQPSRDVRYLNSFFVALVGTLIVGGLVLGGMWVYKTREPANAVEIVPDPKVAETSIETFVENEYQVDVGELEEENIEDDASLDLLSNPEYLRKNKIHMLDENGKDEVTLVFGGDVCLDDSYSLMQNYYKRGGTIDQAFSDDLLNYMRSADICMINNEFPYSKKGKPLEGKAFTFRANPQNVSILQDMGVDIVSMANNHASDYGVVSLLDSLGTLQSAGIECVGAGMNIRDASQPAYYWINGMRIAIVAATQVEMLDNPDTKGATENEAGVFRCWNEDRIYGVLQEAKANSDFVIFYVHWGTESTTELNWGQTTYVNRYVEAGADVIIGDHPHVLQKISEINGAPVIYSVGNFWFNSKDKDTGMIELKLTKEGLKSFRFVPCLQSSCRTVMLEGEEKARVLQYMRDLSKDVVIDEEGYLVR